MGDLSELELVVLGIVWKRGPCTPYAVRKEFATSPSSHWSGSAGSIYPLVRRLERRGYLRSRRESQGRRARRTYTITRRGTAALRRWVCPPLPDEAAAITYDPIRTRMYFLGIVPPDRQSGFLAEAEAALRRQIRVVQAECARYAGLGDTFSHLAMTGALRIMRARIAWLANARKSLGCMTV
ncbi:MAG TPA: PadR family transcriptional regulator [Phycisphaerae bacterium]|nr:PadR family transcriptional regulator [Phycisphaerae bacterium]